MQSKNQDNKVAKTEERSVEFIPFGASDKIRLTAAMVRQFIAVPTKSGAMPTERDCIRFIMLCMGKRANPFEGDCFLIGYDTPKGPNFSMVCGIELFLKRASMEASYDGMESGVIILDANNNIRERAGALVLHGETLVGGWAKVHRKDRKQPVYKTVKLETYNTGQSRWLKDPGGMIVKVAESQALRTAYPTALGGLYTQEEMQRLTEAGENIVGPERPAIQMPREKSTEAQYVSPAPETIADVKMPEATQPITDAVEAAIESPTTGDAEQEQAAESAPTDAGEIIQGVLAVVTEKKGKNARGEYIKYGMRIEREDGTGIWVNTFDKTIGEQALALRDKKPTISMLAKNGKYGMDYVGEFNVLSEESTTDATSDESVAF